MPSFGRYRSQRRRGAMVIMIALLLPVLLILVGFSVDLGAHAASAN